MTGWNEAASTTEADIASWDQSVHPTSVASWSMASWCSETLHFLSLSVQLFLARQRLCYEARSCRTLSHLCLAYAYCKAGDGLLLNLQDGQWGVPPSTYVPLYPVLWPLWGIVLFYGRELWPFQGWHIVRAGSTNWIASAANPSSLTGWFFIFNSLLR